MAGSVFGLMVLFCIVTVAEGYVRAPWVIESRAGKPGDLGPGDLSAEQLRILLTVEDPAFFTHRGVDFHTPGAGMTTITQGLVKLLYFKQFRPGLAKIRQSLLAIGFDSRMDKASQLGLFLNLSSLGTHEGRSVIGFADAARTYYRKPFSTLTREEYVSLVAMCIGPNQYSVSARPAENARRVRRIETLLAGQCQPKGWRDVYYDACEHSPEFR